MYGNDCSSITEEIKVVEFHSPNPKFFHCGNTFNYFRSSFVAEHTIILAVFAFEQLHSKLRGSTILTF